MRANSNTCLVSSITTPMNMTILTFLSIGEPFKDRFEGIMINDAASEGNFIRSNGVFTAVIQIEA